MPVQIVSFNGKNKNGYNDLKWKIANPIDFDYFQVKRSFDTKSFERVSEKIPLGNTEDYYWSEKWYFTADECKFFQKKIKQKLKLS